MARDSGKLYPFPSDLVDPKVKEDKEKYGLPLARAIYYNNRQQGSSLFYNDRRLHKYYIDYALGEQDTEKYKPFLGINTNNIKQSMLSSVRWNIRNYATKRINALVSRVSSQEFDPVVEAIDQMAIDIKGDYKARLQQFIKEKDWVNQLGDMIGMDLTPFGLNIEEVPENDEEIDIHLQTNVKLRSEMELEEGISLHLDRNNYEQKRKQLIFDLFVIGVGALWTGVDGYGNPIIKRISPQDMIVPYSEVPNFDNINYAGHLERMTVGELKKLAGDEFSKDEYLDIEENFTNTSDREHDYYDYQNDGSITDSGDIKKIKVVHFEYLTQNEMVHISKKDKFGNERFSRQKYDTYKTKKEQEKFKKKYGDSRSLHRTPYTACLSGYYIVGSKYLFKYGIKKNNPRSKGALGNTTLGYSIFAPNMYSGKLVSSLKQMIPVLDDLQEYSLKIQQVVSSAVPKGLEIDLFELSKAKLKGKGGRELSDMEKLEMYFQRGIIVRNSEGKYAQGSGTTPVRELENGMARDVVNYLNLIANAKEELDEITGINRAMAGGNLHQDMGKAVTQMQVQSSETAIDYIYDADAYIFNQMVRNLGILHVQSVKNGKDFKLYEKAIGKSSITFLKDSGIDKHDYGFFVENRPSKEEWQRFYQSVDVALQQKEISLADYTYIFRIDNLKRAQQYLVFAEKKRQKQLQQQKEADMQMNQQMQQQSNEQAHANAMAVEQAKQQLILLQAEEERKTIQMKIELETEKEMQLEELRSGAKLEMNDRLARAKEDGDLLKTQSQEDIEVYKSLTQNKNN